MSDYATPLRGMYSHEPAPIIHTSGGRADSRSVDLDGVVRHERVTQLGATSKRPMDASRLCNELSVPLWPNFSAPKAVITQMAEYENGGKVRVARSEHDTPSLSRRSSHTTTFRPRNTPAKTCQRRPPHSRKVSNKLMHEIS